MTLTTCTPRFFRLLPPPPSPSSLPKLCETCAVHCDSTSFLPRLLGSSSVSFNISKFIKAKASVSESDHEISENNVSELLDQEFLARIAAAEDANEALPMIAEKSRRDEGVVGTSDCCSIISAAHCDSTSFLPRLLGSSSVSFNISKFIKAKASVSESDHEISENNVSELLDQEFLARIAAAEDANEALPMIAEKSRRDEGVVGTSDCCSIISAALNRNNAELALSVFFAMRASFNQDAGNGPLVKKWKWSRPNAHVYTLLIQGLASALRVSDALRVIKYICEVAVSPGEEVPFGMIVRCPSCRIAVAVAQPQQGIQLVSCAKCRYQYELVSGDIIGIQSEEISMDITPWERGLKFLQLKKQSTPAAVHSIVVQTPSGMARTHRFATETVDVPAQVGERVTVAVAAPSNVYRAVGPFRFSPRAPDFYPGEAMCLTNHKDGRESLLLRAPRKEGNSSLLQPSFLFPLLAVFTTGDAASGLIDPSLPQFISVVAVSSLAVGATLNSFVFPQLNQLPQGSVEAIAIKQQLLSQYDVLQSRIKDLKEASEKEVWMLARMCQLENKISVVGEPSYRARKTRIKRVQESLQKSLRGRIELIDSYARISSMIEIEVEMDTDVPAAETASNADNIMEQIQQITELENLEERWKIQAEANDEAERLLSSQSLPNEEV